MRGGACRPGVDHRRRQPASPRRVGRRRVRARACPTLPAIPSLPRRSPAEGMIAQAVVGIRGRHGRPVRQRRRRRRRLDPVGAGRHRPRARRLRRVPGVPRGTPPTAAPGPVKWQFVGPVTLGAGARSRAGVPGRAGVRRRRPAPCAAHVARCSTAVAERPAGVRRSSSCSTSRRSATLCSPASRSPPTPRSTSCPARWRRVEPVGHGRRALLRRRRLGVAARRRADGPVAAGAPTSVGVAGYLGRFLDGGGWIAWGAVPRTGRSATGASVRGASSADLWCELVQARLRPGAAPPAGIDHPGCGLGAPQRGHRRAGAATHLREIGRPRPRPGRPPTRFVLGA